MESERQDQIWQANLGEVSNMSKSGKNGSTGGNGAAVVKRGRVENLKPWKPGQSGNPQGGRVRRPLTALLEKQLNAIVPGSKGKLTVGEQLVAQIIKRAIKKSDALAKEIFERMDGKIAVDEAQANVGVRVILMDGIPRPDRSAFIHNNGNDEEE
jgi:Family of unknown function (DUF5681)